MSEPDRCPECGAELPSGALAGLCPKCLMAAGLESRFERSPPASSGSAAPTTPHAGSFVPPEPAMLAGHFPQLEIFELLGHGGMGAVYKARQINLDRLVALKIIRPESADTPAFEERFNREAKTLARLGHPHIVAMHEFGEVRVSDAGPGFPQRPLYYFLMEYVDGANLRQLMRAGELTPEQALAIVPQICDALQFAHDEGVVHRDIKPENILLDKRGRVKIADFGLAKLAAGSPEEFTLTGTHQVMGTPRYMAPEQMEGSHAVDHRADIFSLGIVFYEMLTGEVPAGHFEPPSKKVAIDVRLDEVVLRAMAREPERRYQQAGDVKTDMESISSTPRPRTAAPFPEAPADDAQIQAARQLVQFPAIGLIVVGSFLTAAATFAAFTMAWWTSGRGSQTSSDGSEFLLIVPVILALVALPAAIIIGGVKMLRLTDHRWAMGASVLAVSPIPSVPVWFLSLPLGIWSLVVLSKPEVKRGFALRRKLARGEQAALGAAAPSNVPESPSPSRRF
jgi:serine/threonine protein kinase